MPRVSVGVTRYRTLTVLWSWVLSIGRNLQSFINNDDVSKWVKNSRMGLKTLIKQNKQTTMELLYTILKTVAPYRKLSNFDQQGGKYIIISLIYCSTNNGAILETPTFNQLYNYETFINYGKNIVQCWRVWYMYYTKNYETLNYYGEKLWYYTENYGIIVNYRFLLSGTQPRPT